MTRLIVLAIALLVPVRSAAGIQKSAAEVFRISHDGVVRSINGGENWVQANAGLPQGIGALAAPITAIASENQHVYALTETDGVYLWINSDNAWVSAHRGLPVPLLRRTEGSLLAVDPADGSRVYTLLNIPVTSEREQALLFGSHDGGRTWAQLKDLSDIARERQLHRHGRRPALQQAGSVLDGAADGIRSPARHVDYKPAAGIQRIDYVF